MFLQEYVEQATMEDIDKLMEDIVLLQEEGDILQEALDNEFFKVAFLEGVSDTIAWVISKLRATIAWIAKALLGGRMAGTMFTPKTPESLAMLYAEANGISYQQALEEIKITSNSIGSEEDKINAASMKVEKQLDFITERAQEIATLVKKQNEYGYAADRQRGVQQWGTHGQRLVDASIRLQRLIDAAETEASAELQKMITMFQKGELKHPLQGRSVMVASQLLTRQIGKLNQKYEQTLAFLKGTLEQYESALGRMDAEFQKIATRAEVDADVAIRKQAGEQFATQAASLTRSTVKLKRAWYKLWIGRSRVGFALQPTTSPRLTQPGSPTPAFVPST